MCVLFPQTDIYSLLCVRIVCKVMDLSDEEKCAFLFQVMSHLANTTGKWIGIDAKFNANWLSHTSVKAVEKL